MAPPPGIVATSATVAQILKLHEKSIGSLAPGGGSTRRETWALNYMGLTGIETLVRSGTDYRATIQHGALVEEYGQDEGKRWHRGMNGTVSPAKGNEDESFVMLRVLEDAADPKNDVKLLGEVETPAQAYVVEVRRPGTKRLEWVFYDKTSGLVDRVEENHEGYRFVSTYGDYRTTSGITEPWHVHDVLGDTGAEFDYVRQTLVTGAAVNRSDFAAPESRFNPARYSSEVALPARFRDWTVTVRVTVNGRGLDFELSPGSPKSVIDRDVARELQLPTFGQLTRTKDGKNLGYDTEIAKATVGKLELSNFGVRALEFNYEPTQDTKVVGLLGYDFLCQGFFKVDYVNGRVWQLDPAKADELAEKPGTTVIPLSFDDGFPMFKGTIAGHETENILFDSSFPFTFIFGSFSTRYPEAVPDLEGHKRAHTVIPFADSQSYGREVDLWQSRIKSAQFGTATFNNLQTLVTDADLFDQDVDAVLGQNVLQFFDEYLDFAHARVILEPNEWFSRAFRKRTP